MKRHKTRFARYRPASRPRRAQPFCIRPAEPRDAAEVARISSTNRQADPKLAIARISGEIALTDGSSMLFVAELRDRIVAFARARYFEPQPGDPEDIAPPGHYLLGIVVEPGSRRLGIANALTAARLEWIARRADHAYYFANEQNLASIALHERFGFVEISRHFVYPRVSFSGGQGVLFRASLVTASSAGTSGQHRALGITERVQASEPPCRD